MNTCRSDDRRPFSFYVHDHVRLINYGAFFHVEKPSTEKGFLKALNKFKREIKTMKKFWIALFSLILLIRNCRMLKSNSKHGERTQQSQNKKNHYQRKFSY